MRPVEGQYDVSPTAIWLLVSRVLNGNIWKFLNGEELIGFKSVSKSTKSAIESEEGEIFYTIREQLKEKIIEEGQFRSVPDEHNFKIKNQVKFGPRDEVGYIFKTTKKNMFVVCDGGVFKVGVDVERVKNLGTEHVLPYLREVEEEVQHWRRWASMTSEYSVVLTQCKG